MKKIAEGIYAMVLDPAAATPVPAAPERIQPVCAHCHSEDVCIDATARWNIRAQQWEMTDTYEGSASCDECNGETSLIDAPLVVDLDPPCALTDAQALDAIAALTTGKEWNPDTLDAIAEIVREAGRTIADTN